MASVGPLLVAGAVEERENVSWALGESASERADLDERGRDAGGDGVDDVPHHLSRLLLVGLPVGGDNPLVDAPGRFDFHVLRGGEHRMQPCGLLLSEEARSGVEGAADAVERVTCVIPVADC